MKKQIPKQFLGAFKKGHRFAARQLVDDEYSYRLLERALVGDIEALRGLEFITKFNNEYYKGIFKYDGSDFHSTECEWRKKWRDQNAMVRDVLVRASYPLPIDRPPLFADEDTLIELIDLKNEMEKSNKQ